MTITSPAFTTNGIIPPPHTCEGANTNPPLVIADAPKTAITLALVVEDPDSPSGLWQHWLMWDVAPDTQAIEPGQTPTGAMQGMNDFGRQGYGGPCPAIGVHHYVFRLYALDTKLMLGPTANRRAFYQAIRGHILAAAELVGQFGHNQA